MKKKTTLWILSIILLIPVVFMPLVVLLSSETHLSAEQLLHKDISEDLMRGRSTFIEPTSYHLFLSKINIDQTILGVLFLLVIYILIHFILKDNKFSDDYRALFSVIFILSPALIGNALFTTEPLFYLIFLLATVFFFGRNLNVLAYISFILYASSNIAYSLVGLIIVTFFFIFIKKRENISIHIIILFILSIIAMLISGIKIYYNYHSQYLSPLTIFTELGAFTGLGIFFTFLAIFGIISKWKNKKYSLTILVGAIVLLGLYNWLGQFSFIITTLVLAFPATSFLLKLINDKWESKFIKQMAIVAIISGLLFAQFAYLDRSYTLIPDKNTIEAMEFIKTRLPPNAVILSHPSNGYSLIAVADKHAYTTYYKSENYDLSLQKEVANLLFSNRDFDETVRILDRSKIGYIFLTPQMKNGQIWHRDNEGLLFILRDKNKFTKIYGKGGYDIYRVNHES